MGCQSLTVNKNSKTPFLHRWLNPESCCKAWRSLQSEGWHSTLKMWTTSPKLTLTFKKWNGNGRIINLMIHNLPEKEPLLFWVLKISPQSPDHPADWRWLRSQQAVKSVLMVDEEEDIRNELRVFPHHKTYVPLVVTYTNTRKFLLVSRIVQN